jgi:hypothetical protein
LDPPYPGTTSYEKEYVVLDRLLEGRQHERSAFSGVAPPLHELLRACNHIPIWVVSLGNAAIALDELVDRIGKYRLVRQVVELPYRHLESIASEEKNAKNREHLILAVR